MKETGPEWKGNLSVMNMVQKMKKEYSWAVMLDHRHIESIHGKDT